MKELSVENRNNKEKMRVRRIVDSVTLNRGRTDNMIIDIFNYGDSWIKRSFSWDREPAHPAIVLSRIACFPVASFALVSAILSLRSPRSFASPKVALS